MKITSHISKIRSIKLGDPKFLIVDGFVATPRAGFEINHQCPKEYRMIIQQCLHNGWLKPVAHIKDSELFWESLGE